MLVGGLWKIESASAYQRDMLPGRPGCWLTTKERDRIIRKNIGCTSTSCNILSSRERVTSDTHQLKAVVLRTTNFDRVERGHATCCFRTLYWRYTH
jgi:hypothetical protein